MPHRPLSNELPAISHRDQLGHLLNQFGLKGAGVELGVLTGSFSDTILRSWDGRELYLIDSWRERDGYRDSANAPNVIQDQRYIEVLKRFWKQMDRVRPIRAPGAQAVGLFGNDTLDFVYIDADHSYDACSEDLHLWYPKVRLGGLMAGHDYLDSPVDWETVFDVKRAVDDFVRGLSERGHDLRLYVTAEPFPTWYFRKVSPFYGV